MLLFRKLIRECVLGINFLGEREGNDCKEKLDCAVVSTKASADPMGSSWAGMTFRVIASWSEENWPLQQSPTYLAPGTSFVEDNFSMDQGGPWK